MELNYGIGIGLQGRAPMFEGIAKAREVAVKNQQAKKQAEEADRIRKSQNIFLKDVSGKRFLPVDEDVVNKSIADANDVFEQQVTSDTPDMLAISQVTNNAVRTATFADERRKQFEKIMLNPRQFGVFQEDIDIVLNERDPNKINERLQLEGSGAFLYDPQTRELKSNLLGKFEPVSDQAANFVKAYGDKLFTESDETQEFQIYNRKFQGRKINDAATASFLQAALSGDNLESTRREWYMTEMKGKPKPARGSQEEMDALQQFVTQKWENAAAPLAVFNSASPQKSSTFNINIGQDKEQAGEFTTETESLNIYPDLGRVLGLNSSFSYTPIGELPIGETKTITSVPYSTFNAKTAERITETSGTVSGSRVVIGPIYTGPTRIFRGKINGEQVEVTLEKGKPIPDQMVAQINSTIPNSVQYGKVVYASFTPTNSKTSQSIIYPSRKIEDAAVVEANKKKAEEMQVRIDKMNAFLKKNKTFTEKQLEEQLRIVKQGGGEIFTETEKVNTGTVVREPQSPQRKLSLEEYLKQNPGKTRVDFFNYLRQ